MIRNAIFIYCMITYRIFTTSHINIATSIFTHSCISSTPMLQKTASAHFPIYGRNVNYYNLMQSCEENSHVPRNYRILNSHLPNSLNLLSKRRCFDEQREYKFNGRWTEEEKMLFEKAIQTHGRKWSILQKCIPTRTKEQIRSHAQKVLKIFNSQILTDQKSISDQSETNLENVQDSYTDNDEVQTSNLVKEYSKKLNIAFYETTDIIKRIIDCMNNNYGYSKIPALLEELKAKSEDLRNKADMVKPLSTVALKNLAELKKDVVNITHWWINIEEGRQAYKKLRYLYPRLDSEHIDLSKLNFLSIIRRKPKENLLPSTNGFIKL